MRTVAFCVTLLAAGAARAQVDERAARTHFEAGSSYYDQGRYEDALREFEEAFRIAPDAQKGLMVFNMGQAQERLGRLEAAIGSFRRYLELEPTAGDHAAVEQRVGLLQARIEETGIVLTVSQDGARVSLDGEQAGTSPLAAPLLVAPGPHELLIEREGFQPVRLRVNVESGRRVEAEATLLPEAPRPPDRPPERPPDRPPAREPPRGRLFTWIAAGLGGVAVAGGVVLGILALGESDTASDEATGSRERYDEADSSAGTLALLADISFGVAILSAGAAVILFFVEAPTSGETARLTPVPVVLRDGAAVQLCGSF